jgi:hypothetical protein
VVPSGASSVQLRPCVLVRCHRNSVFWYDIHISLPFLPVWCDYVFTQETPFLKYSPKINWRAGDIMALNGALTIVPLCFIAPCVFYIIKKGKENLSMWEKIFITLIIVINSIVGVMGVIASMRQIILDASTYKMFQ